MDREEFREQMTRCRGCGQLSDGGCCPPEPLAYMVEKDWTNNDNEDVVTRDFYCVRCAQDEDQCDLDAEPVYDKALLQNPYTKEECCICGEALP